MKSMFVVLRAATYASVFIGLLLIFVPARLLSRSALAGVALFYRSPGVLLYTLAFILITHGFAVLYEEPTLEATFGVEYREYRQRVRRWWPSLPGPDRTRGRRIDD
jgi:protein-S-isoprenylcysteine O-methyltransferase Ste14